MSSDDKLLQMEHEERMHRAEWDAYVKIWTRVVICLVLVVFIIAYYAAHAPKVTP